MLLQNIMHSYDKNIWYRPSLWDFISILCISDATQETGLNRKENNVYFSYRMSLRLI